MLAELGEGVLLCCLPLRVCSCRPSVSCVCLLIPMQVARHAPFLSNPQLATTSHRLNLGRQPTKRRTPRSAAPSYFLLGLRRFLHRNGGIAGPPGTTSSRAHSAAQALSPGKLRVTCFLFCLLICRCAKGFFSATRCQSALQVGKKWQP